MTSYSVETSKRVAYDSPDHLAPCGAINDNSRNPLFTRKLEAVFANRRLRILDLGCAGGGFVKDCLGNGHEAIGIEGSDCNQKAKRAEWETIPQNLFTADIVEPFTVQRINGDQQAEPMTFDVVTAWELMEHLQTADIPSVITNVARHLTTGGIWIASVADFPHSENGVVYHQTVQPRDWWIRMLAECGFTHHPLLVEFFGYDWVRGPLQGSNSFHLVATRTTDDSPAVPEGFQFPPRELYDRGISFLQQAVAQQGPWISYAWYAVLLFRQAMRGVNRNAELHYACGYAYAVLGRAFEAQQELHFALEDFPGHKGAQDLLTQLGDIRTNDMIRR